MSLFDDQASDATALYQPNDMIALRMGRLAATRLNEDRLQRFAMTFAG